MRLIDELNHLHDHYRGAVNDAVARDDYELAEELADAYDDEAIRLIAEREGRQHMLPIERPTLVESSLRRMLRRLRAGHAA